MADAPAKPPMPDAMDAGAALVAAGLAAMDGWGAAR